MIIRLENFIFEEKDETPEIRETGKLSIKWVKPDLAEELEHYDGEVKTEFYQHNIEIPNNDIGKVKPRATRFYRYLKEPFNKGKISLLPTTSEDEFQVTKIQHFSPYEFENIVAGAYGRAYGDVLIQLTDDLKKRGQVILPAPIVIRFINFGETRRSGESSYYLFSGERRMNLALHYGIPVKVWVVDLIPSRRDVREFAEKAGALRAGEQPFKKHLRRVTGKDDLDDLTARERFKVIQSLKSFKISED